MQTIICYVPFLIKLLILDKIIYFFNLSRKIAKTFLRIQTRGYHLFTLFINNIYQRERQSNSTSIPPQNHFSIFISYLISIAFFFNWLQTSYTTQNKMRKGKACLHVIRRWEQKRFISSFTRNASIQMVVKYKFISIVIVSTYMLHR